MVAGPYKSLAESLVASSRSTASTLGWESAHPRHSMQPHPSSQIGSADTPSSTINLAASISEPALSRRFRVNPAHPPLPRRLRQKPHPPPRRPWLNNNPRRQWRKRNCRIPPPHSPHRLNRPTPHCRPCHRKSRTSILVATMPWSLAMTPTSHCLIC